MSRLENWKERALDDIAASSLSYAAIARKYGQTEHQIIKLKKEHGEHRGIGVLFSGSKSPDHAEVLSDWHQAVGARLRLYRGQRSLSEAADELGTTRYVLRFMEEGRYDFSLAQLRDLSEKFGVSISEMLTPILGLS
jgi:hypothetical protein